MYQRSTNVRTSINLRRKNIGYTESFFRTQNTESTTNLLILNICQETTQSLSACKIVRGIKRTVGCN